MSTISWRVMRQRQLGHNRNTWTAWKRKRCLAPWVNRDPNGRAHS